MVIDFGIKDLPNNYFNNTILILKNGCIFVCFVSYNYFKKFLFRILKHHLDLIRYNVVPLVSAQRLYLVPTFPFFNCIFCEQYSVYTLYFT